MFERFLPVIKTSSPAPMDQEPNGFLLIEVCEYKYYSLCKPPSSPRHRERNTENGILSNFD